MRADDRAQAAHELDLGLRAVGEDDLPQLLDRFLGLGVRDRDAEPGAVGRRFLERLRNSSNAFVRPRTLPTGTTSPASIARIGFTFSRLPISARARPMRPPFARNSSVSTVKSMRASLAVARGERLDLLVGRPALEPALDREREHPDSDRRRLGVDEADPVAAVLRAASEALWNVPDSFDEMWSE